MGGGVSSFFWWRRKKEVVIERRPVVTEWREIVRSTELMERFAEAVKFFPPGTVLRFDKLLQFVNREIEPTPEEVDPARMLVKEEDLMEILRHKYESIRETSSDGLSLMREKLPKYFDKHSLERGRRVSQRERDTSGLTDESYAYGEFDTETFATIMEKINQTFGFKEKGCFYDLGCGVGNLVYTAAFIGDFSKVGGIEIVSSLLERGVKRNQRYIRDEEGFPKAKRNLNWVWLNKDFLKDTSWTEASFLFLHLTALNTRQLLLLGRIASECAEGTIVLSITNPVQNTDFELLVKGECKTSWGSASYYVQEKIRPAKKVLAAAPSAVT